MCPFNGPNATKKNSLLSTEVVNRTIDSLEPGSDFFLSSGGDVFMDPNAEDYLQRAIDHGLNPILQSHGQLYSPERLERLLKMGIREFRMSVDAIVPHQYEKIRRGGKFQNVLDAVDYLNSRRQAYPTLTIMINATLFKKTFDKQDDFIEFWSGKVDTLGFNAEYYDTFKFRNIFGKPEKRVDCAIRTFVQPSGKIAPCCAIGIHAHENDLDWLPTVETHTLQEAYDHLCDLYDDPNSPLSKLCASCDWWILFDQQGGQTPYYKQIELPSLKPTAPEPSHFLDRDEAATLVQPHVEIVSSKHHKVETLTPKKVAENEQPIAVSMSSQQQPKSGRWESMRRMAARLFG